ncbi:TonB C-terminal domain-containing protein [Candidatus Thioglobus sp.]|uniref:TonB C-terminal domain-containing protein n=1 Tax=Candidatus Thioglobus sp. TaxID=2026721 RepID=UPI003D12E730
MKIKANKLISKLKPPKIAKKHPVAFWLAIALHVALLIGIVFSNVQRWEIPQKESKSTSTAIKSVTVDLTEIKKEKQRLINIRQAREKHLVDLQRAEKRVENERYKEQQRLKKLKAKVEQEKQAKKQAEKNTKAAEQKTKQILDKKKAAEQKARKAEKAAKASEARKKAAEKAAKTAEQNKQKIEDLRKLEASKFEKEQDNRSLKKEIQAEEQQERVLAQEDILNKLKTSYINQIAARVKGKWRFQDAKDHWRCDVRILQDLNGKVQIVNIQSCNVSSNAKSRAFKDSIERAIYKASPLPNAPDKSVFDREILFIFKVN